MSTVTVWMGLGNRPRALTRQQYRALAMTWAGETWDELHARHGFPTAKAEAWATRTEEELQADALSDLERLRVLYAAQPRWTDADSDAERASGRDPRRTLALRQAVRAQRDADDARAHAKRMRTPPCAACGYAAGHGHHSLCSEDA